MGAFDDFAFVSSGDPEEDERIAARIRLNKAREAEGMCPNGCAALEWPDPNALYSAVCPKCNFRGYGPGAFAHPSVRQEPTDAG